MRNLEKALIGLFLVLCIFWQGSANVASAAESALQDEEQTVIEVEYADGIHFEGNAPEEYIDVYWTDEAGREAAKDKLLVVPTSDLKLNTNLTYSFHVVNEDQSETVTEYVFQIMATQDGRIRGTIGIVTLAGAFVLGMIAAGFAARFFLNRNKRG